MTILPRQKKEKQAKTKLGDLIKRSHLKPLR